MTANEFLSKLEDALQGQIPSSAVASNLRYYQNYIGEERRKGRREEDILEELGDPRLIARTIVETQNGAGSYTGHEESRRSTESREVYRDEERSFRDESWKRWLILILVLVVIVLVVSSIFGLAVRILFSPVFWIILAVIFLFRILGGRRR